jgi:adenosylmethionine-8-amino-7-oxononanoate aminotransferase
MSAVLHRSLDTDLPVVVGGEGPYLIDRTGKRYFDGSGGAAVSCLGHSHPRVVAAIHAQVERIAYAHTFFFTNEPAEALAAHLVARAPSGFGDGAAMFLGSGSEAMEAALKLVRQYWVERGQPSKARIIAREMAFHGNTLAALAVGGHRQRRAPYEPMLMPVGRIPACYEYRGRRSGESPEQYGQRVADALEHEILALGPENVAAFVAETVSGATLGCVPPAAGYFRRIRDICDRHDVLFIADEVMCGMGRCGSFFAIESEGVCPDVITAAKGLGAGYQPIAAVLASAKVMDVVRNGSGTLANGHTYMSHALACAGALAVVETIEEEGLLAQVRERGRDLEIALEETFGQHPHVGDIRGRGLFRAVEFVADRSGKTPFPQAFRLAARFRHRAQEHGLICYPASGCVDGILGDHLLLAPPFIATREQIREMVVVCREVLAECLE